MDFETVIMILSMYVFSSLIITIISRFKSQLPGFTIALLSLIILIGMPIMYGIETETKPDFATQNWVNSLEIKEQFDVFLSFPNIEL